MSFFNSLQQIVSSGVANLSLSPKRFSLSRESSGSTDGGTGDGTAANALSISNSPINGPGSRSGSTGSVVLPAGLQHGFPKVVPAPGTASSSHLTQSLFARRRTLDGSASMPTSSQSTNFMGVPPAPRRVGSFRHQHSAQVGTDGHGDGHHVGHHTHYPLKHQHALTGPLLQGHMFCKRRPSWPEVDQRAISGVQEIDGSFFESYTALSWKHENRIRHFAQTRNRQEETVPSEREYITTSAGPGAWLPADIRQNHKEMEQLYVEVLYTIANKIGASPSHYALYQDDLYDYAQDAFRIPNEQHRRYLAIASEEKPPIVVLNVIVIEADGLEAKDANGFSDPYCLLGLVRGTNGPSLSNNHHNNVFGQHSRQTSLEQEQQELEVQFGQQEGGSPIIASPVAVIAGTIGFSDPYCMLGIQPASSGSSVGSVGAALSGPPSPQPPVPCPPHSAPAGTGVGMTGSGSDRGPGCPPSSPRPPSRALSDGGQDDSSPHPEKIKKHHSDIDDVNSDILHLDIWDHDDESSVLDAVSKLNEVRGVKGLGRFFKQIAQSARSSSTDDFLGCVNVPLVDIPSTGLDRWYQLEARTQRSSVQGKIRLKLWLSTREDRGTSEEDNWSDLRQQERLHEVFIAHELQGFNGPSWEWGGELPAAAKSVLHQHAIQGDVTDLQLALVRWVAFARTAVSTPIDLRILCHLLRELDKHWGTESLSREEEEALAESFNMFTEYALQMIRFHHQLVSPQHRSTITRFEALLRCISLMTTMKAVSKCCPFNKELRSEIIASLRKAAADWYQEYYQAVLAADNPTSRLQAIIDVVTRLLVDLQNGLKTYHQLFDSVNGVPYFAVVYKHLDKMITNEIGPEVVDLCARITMQELDDLQIAEHLRQPHLGKTLFELYLAFQEFVNLGSTLSVHDRRQLSLPLFYTWYEPAVHCWMDLADSKAIERIRRASEISTICSGEYIVKHSTSAIDTTSCFYHITEFWKILSWPDLVASYNLVRKIIKVISSDAMVYAEITHQKLKNAGYYEDKCPFKTSDEMCAAVNDLEHVRRTINHLSTDLNVESILEAVEAAEIAAATLAAQSGNGTSVEAATQVARANSNGWREEIYREVEIPANKIEMFAMLIIAQVGAKMRPPLKKAMFHLAWSPDSLPTCDAMTPLLQYLDNHLEALNAALLPKNFERTLCDVWEVVLLELGHQMDGNSGDRSPLYYERLHEALELLAEFFYADQKGLPVEMLRSATYYKVEERLQYHKMDTERLISLYYQQRLVDQLACDSTEYGVLFVRAYFNHDSLCVEVINARDVIPLDPNGFSDPFVIIELLPRRVFSHCSEQQTNVQKKTLNPVFDECFEFSVSLEQCRSEGAMILFTVMDYDVLTCNDFAGEAFLALASVPGVADNNSSVDNLHGLKHAELPLMHQKNRNHPILQILESRNNDKIAQDFMKKQKMRFVK